MSVRSSAKAAVSASASTVGTSAKKAPKSAKARQAEGRAAALALGTQAVAAAADALDAVLHPENVFTLGIERLSAVDEAFAATWGREIRLTAGLQRLADGRVTALVTPLLVAHSATTAGPAVQIEADFGAGPGLRPMPAAALHPSDLELEIYLRTDEERLIDVLDFSEISEEADEDGYVVGYVALSNLLRTQELLHKYGAFVARTGAVRPLAAA